MDAIFAGLILGELQRAAEFDRITAINNVLHEKHAEIDREIEKKNEENSQLLADLNILISKI